MRETQFIEQNKGKWETFEAILNNPNNDPEKLQEVFIQVTDDLSYARTFYPNRSVRVYLNGLAQQVFVRIYKNKKSQRNRFLNFWTDELPQLVYESRPAFLLSLLVFLGAFLIGTLSSAMDPAFVEAILGNNYVEMTRANIESGDPMRVYKERDQMGMSLGIAGNNLFVAFLTFVMGIFCMIGSLAVLVSNGIMVGAFQYFFIEQGLFVESFLTIWTHGTLEISAIIIAGAAGITMGRGLVFPGTYSRIKAFRVSARRGLKIMIGVTPIFILAAFIEGFLTRYTQTPDFIRLLFILLCLIYVLGYFAWYPAWKAKTGFQVSNRLHKMTADRDFDIEWYKIKPVSEIFEDTVELYRQHFGQIARTATLGALLYSGAVLLLAANTAEAFVFPYRMFGTLSVVHQFFINEEVPLLFLVVPLVLALVYYRVFYSSNITTTEVPKRIIDWKAAAMALLIGTATYICFYLTQYALMLYALPLFLSTMFLWAAIAFRAEKDTSLNFRQALELLSTSYGKAISLFLLVALVSFLFFNIMDTMVLGFYFDLLAWIFHFEQGIMDQIAAVSLTFVSIGVLLLIFQLFLVAYEVLAYSFIETKGAIQIRKRIQEIEIPKRIQGLEKE